MHAGIIAMLQSLILKLFAFMVFFSKSIFPKNIFQETIIVSNSLDSDQAQHFVGPDLGPYYLQKLSVWHW